MSLYEVKFKGLGNKTIRRLRDSKAEAQELIDYLGRHGIQASLKRLNT